VLLVDDNEDAGDMLGEALRLKGHNVRVAGDGPAALRLCTDWGPQVALVDIGLPLMDGYELAGRIRQMLDGKVRTPIAGVLATRVLTGTWSNRCTSTPSSN
jgi:CheY-like chemotaxis protein